MLVLIWRKDPRARQEKARLDREVGGLEPFLEAMPTYIVSTYMGLSLLVGFDAIKTFSNATPYRAQSQMCGIML